LLVIFARVSDRCRIARDFRFECYQIHLFSPCCMSSGLLNHCYNCFQTL